MVIEYLRKSYIPILALSLALSVPSCLGPKSIEEAHTACIMENDERKIRTIEGILTCKEINELYENP